MSFLKIRFCSALIISILSIPILGLAQEDFSQFDTVHYSSDSLVLKQDSKSYYSYFSASIDSMIVLLGDGSFYHKVYKVDSNNNGEYLIQTGNKTLFYYTVKEGKIEGQARIRAYFDDDYSIYGNFVNGKLEGHLYSYRDPFQIEYIAWYENGIFKRYLFYRDMQKYYKNYKDLNKRKTPPFQVEVHTL